MKYASYAEQLTAMRADFRCVRYRGMVSYGNAFGGWTCNGSQRIFDHWNLDSYGPTV